MANLDPDGQQRLRRLTPLRDVLALIEARVAPVAPTTRALAEACGFTLAADAVAGLLPQHAIALRDGFAVDSAAVADASAYAPVALPAATRRVDVGEQLPAGTDAVLPLDAVTRRGERVEAVAAPVTGEGVLPSGGDAAAQARLRREGERLRPIDIAVAGAAGLDAVSVRVPHIDVVWGSEARSPSIAAAMAATGRAAAAAGSVVKGSPVALEDALAAPIADALIVLGGTGSGRRDRAAQALARHGCLEAHGIAVSPGESAAFGFAGAKPVLLVPGRLDAALAIWLMLGRHLVARLAGARLADAPLMLPLKRKVSSTIGLEELMPVRCDERMAEPLGSGYLSLGALARSDGWIAVPADSEGYQAGANVAVRAWP